MQINKPRYIHPPCILFQLDIGYAVIVTGILFVLISRLTVAVMQGLAILACLLMLASPAYPDDAQFIAQRAALISELNILSRQFSTDFDADGLDSRVLKAMSVVPRHAFVPTAERAQAYANRPLPIGHGQTISQPYIVALMTDLLKIEPGHKVLEIGTGSGYQAAVLAQMDAEVYSIEIIEALHERAGVDLPRQGFDGVRMLLADGYHGWQEHAPFDAIIVTAAASHIPPPLVRQLKEGGRMVIPVGARFQLQQLTLVEKEAGNKVRTHQLLPVRFVPFTGAQ